MDGRLDGKVAVVTGASRGVGKGVALGLGEAGATVYVTGRTLEPGSGASPGSVTETAEQYGGWAARASPSAATTATTTTSPRSSGGSTRSRGGSTSS